MKRSLLVALFAVLGLVGAGFPASAAPALASSAMVGDLCNGTSGCITVDISFSNRSATAVGSVFDDRNAGSTTAVFWFYAGGSFWSEQTRTANNERKSFHFSESGPVGGINYVEVYLVNNSTGDWTEVADFYK
ncbi:hypothetical protein Q5425_30195 [Amycolatopsis sp. A133]|jgi:hypothetical protein|uniref:hypothetical protein n=1 Tax=Amycolatopsis sp. A133 TaxID=3064472 RepID=UPI0027ED4171|nr:hypothetical protein [Amycolatopsis sp. A133]MDQ7808028.1 hypothetical protein [Amycolatopsis sp. A133]